MFARHVFNYQAHLCRPWTVSLDFREYMLAFSEYSGFLAHGSQRVKTFRLMLDANLCENYFETTDECYFVICVYPRKIVAQGWNYVQAVPTRS